MPFHEVAVSLILSTEGGNVAFLGETLHYYSRRVTGEKYKIDVCTMNMGNNVLGYTHKMSPWDVWCIDETLNAKVISMYHDNWGNCYKDPGYLEYIVRRKTREKGIDLRTVSLLLGAGYVHPST